ncbi:MAG TPA: MmcQ/YjbR family DNA-binding protein [Caulobacteraceae bacterium]
MTRGAANAEDVRRLALALDGAVEAVHHGAPSFRVDGKIFCTLRASEGRVMVKLEPEDQHNLCETFGESMAKVPGYWGRKGSTFVLIDRTDPALMDQLLRLAWAKAAPARGRATS